MAAFGCELQAARRSEIGAVDLGDDGGITGRAQGLFEGPEAILRAAGVQPE